MNLLTVTETRKRGLMANNNSGSAIFTPENTRDTNLYQQRDFLPRQTPHGVVVPMVAKRLRLDVGESLTSTTTAQSLDSSVFHSSHLPIISGYNSTFPGKMKNCVLNAEIFLHWSKQRRHRSDGPMRCPNNNSLQNARGISLLLH